MNNTPLKTHGGKHYLSQWIVRYFPKNYSYFIEVFAGGASVLFRKHQTENECLNDIHFPTYAFWRTIKNNYSEFQEKIKKILYTEESFNNALNFKSANLMESAINEYTLRRMSRGGMKKTFAWSNRLRGGKPGDQNAWENSIKSLNKISERIKNVELLNSDFRQVINLYNDEQTLMYLDPPYLKDTRISKEVYDHEMTREDHIDLLNLCRTSQSKIILSGYHSDLYKEMLSGWRCETQKIVNHSSQLKNKSHKIEHIWMNF